MYFNANVPFLPCYTYKNQIEMESTRKEANIVINILIKSSSEATETYSLICGEKEITSIFMTCSYGEQKLSKVYSVLRKCLCSQSRYLQWFNVGVAGKMQSH